MPKIFVIREVEYPADGTVAPERVSRLLDAIKRPCSAQVKLLRIHCPLGLVCEMSVGYGNSFGQHVRTGKMFCRLRMDHEGPCVFVLDYDNMHDSLDTVP